MCGCSLIPLPSSIEYLPLVFFFQSLGATVFFVFSVSFESVRPFSLGGEAWSRDILVLPLMLLHCFYMCLCVFNKLIKKGGY